MQAPPTCVDVGEHPNERALLRPYMYEAHLAKFAECKVCEAQALARLVIRAPLAPFFRWFTVGGARGRTLHNTGLLWRSPLPIRPRLRRGFTLIEVMTAVVILIILATLAVTFMVYGVGKARVNNAVFDVAAL
ncbi:MAG: prepilin-type N-terminal cleavage/methylation domain-containing protein, partial [Myxococcaceae bacterium]|nr:prepilin-type N-terminal cleavage/methylation domain-containing protein [Myxococcaceae bacterium]